MIKLKTQKSRLNKSILLITIILAVFGLLMVYSASANEAIRDFSDKYYYLKYQSQWLLIGLILMMMAIYTPYKLIKKIAPLVFGINIILLILVLIPGVGPVLKGARRWLNFGFFYFQPSELLKITFITYLATWLEKARPFGHFLILLTGVFLLIILEPDLGTAVVISTSALLTYYLSGAGIINLILLGMGVLATGILAIFSSEYRRQRLMTLFNPQADPQGASYHIRQVLIALGSGGLFGLGFGQSRQKFQYLPEATTDSIFAIIAEEIGFVGAAAVIILFIILIIKGFQISLAAPDKFSQILVAGLICYLGLQTIINLGAMVALLPLTGIPLPFISYGGSALVVALIAMGLIINISRYRVLKK